MNNRCESVHAKSQMAEVLFASAAAARVRLPGADKDLETPSGEPPYKEGQAKFGRCAVEFRTVITCSKCQQPIVSGEGFGFVCFKIPGQES